MATVQLAALPVVGFYRRIQAHAWSRRRLAMVAVLMREGEAIDRLSTGQVVLHVGPDSVAWDVTDTHGKVKLDELIGA
ncbi:MAG TPA: hypothetical protein VKG45_03770 [Actinomycetes bacterium]|nr:hypothetical protein [Actinomycetes bacterium]